LRARARRYFGERVAFYLDAGPAAEVTASTVVSVSGGGEIALIRAGAVDLSKHPG
jgi:tRNA A37 threonylcarbamoyladenosine synthetase subunit TsaC/SUA5/YrdC